MTNICPSCENGSLVSHLGTESFPYAGERLSVGGYEYSLCDACGEEFVLPEQARRNELRFADAKRAHDRLLISSEIIAWREHWKLTQAQAASLLGGGANAFSKYERGEVSQARSMDLLIRVSDRFAEVRAFLAEIAGTPFGEDWETVDCNVEESPSSTNARRVAPCSVTDIVAYRTRQANVDLAAQNDGEWRSEEADDAGRIQHG